MIYVGQLFLRISPLSPCFHYYEKKKNNSRAMQWFTDAVPALRMPKPGESQVIGQVRIHTGSVKDQS